jgi:hypothetical protein
LAQRVKAAETLVTNLLVDKPNKSHHLNSLYEHDSHLSSLQPSK